METIRVPVRDDGHGNIIDARNVCISQAPSDAAPTAGIVAAVNLQPALMKVRGAADRVLRMHEAGQKQGGLRALIEKGRAALVSHLDQFGAALHELEDALTAVDKELERRS